MKFCVIGLGRFGYQVATVLGENGMEVLAIDSNEAIINSIRDNVTQAVCARITDEASLRAIGVDEMDTVIVATGENFAQPILITALLKQRLNIPTVIARAISEIHKEILKLLGANRVILPEKAIGIRLGDQLSSPFMDLIRLSTNFSISKIVAPDSFVGKQLGDLALFKNYKVRCIGITQEEQIQTVGLDYVIQNTDKLVLAGMTKDLEIIARL